jgi:4-hydroxy-2-oxoheptanedioate aldolase
VMLETGTAIENADAIAAVPGIDVVMIGTNDLAADLGVPGELDHPSVVSAYEKTISACERHGKVAGMGGVYAHELMRRYIEMGVRFMLGGSDVSFIMDAGKRRAEFLASLRTA